MADIDKKQKNKVPPRNKNDLPVFDSGHDFFEEFEREKKEKIDLPKTSQTTRQGIPMLDPLTEGRGSLESRENENFAELLEQSFEQQKAKPVKKISPLPLKKRLKRYPPVEVELDLHGYTALGAQMTARSFICTCRQKGYFTVRIIVGKGLHSDFGPVLPDVIEDVAREMKKQRHIIWYEWDRKKKARSGALIIYLKQF